MLLHYGLFFVPGASLLKGNDNKYALSEFLIVEDDPDMRSFSSQIEQQAMSDRRGEVKKASEGCRREPELILVNVMMPIVNAWEAASMLRGSRETKEIPILAIAALFVPRISSCVLTRV